MEGIIKKVLVILAMVLISFLLSLQSWAVEIEKFPPEPGNDKLVRILVIFSEKGILLAHQYRINEETEDIDYQTIRPLRKQGYLLAGKKFPSGYWYDINQDGEISDDEVLLDRLEDGLNGNEITLEKYKKIEEIEKNGKNILIRQNRRLTCKKASGRF